MHDDDATHMHKNDIKRDAAESSAPRQLLLLPKKERGEEAEAAIAIMSMAAALGLPPSRARSFVRSSHFPHRAFLRARGGGVAHAQGCRMQIPSFNQWWWRSA